MTKVAQLLRMERNVSSLNVTVPFYCDALGFKFIEIKDNTARLKLGDQQIWLCETTGAVYPKNSMSNDLWFQHCAIVTSGMQAAYARLQQNPHEAISINGPVQLPANTGGVSAYKFRDPDGHPLELIYFPPGSGKAQWQQQSRSDNPNLGIDHSAISVADAVRSIEFYCGLLGFILSARQTNQGIAQDQLDNLASTRVEVIALSPESQPTPHLELLAYQNPRGQNTQMLQPSAIASDRLVWAVSDLKAVLVKLDRERYVTAQTHNGNVSLKDPDGHNIALIDRNRV